MMKLNQWTLALISAGLVTSPALLRADDASAAASAAAAVTPTKMSGYVDTSAQWNIGTGNMGTPTYSFGGTGKADGFNLNVVKLTIEKPVEAADTWGAGYKVDLLFGPDANTLATTSTGVTTSDFGVKQAYVALHAPVGNGLDFKLGVFDTVLGYEVFESVNNPNFTRSYGYTIEPTTHTGLQANYTFNDLLSACFCVVNTFGPTINGRANPPKAESYKAYMGSVTLTAPKDWGFFAGSTLSGAVINGFNSGFGADQTSWYVGGTFNTPLTALKIGASYDYAGISKQPLTGNTSAFANATALYVLYQATEKLALNFRGEYATSDTGVFAAKKVIAGTFTAQYDLWKNVVSRLEFRWDHAADASAPYGGTFAPGGKDNSYILLANVAYKF